MPQEKFGFLDQKLNINVHFKKFVRDFYANFLYNNTVSVEYD